MEHHDTVFFLKHKQDFRCHVSISDNPYYPIDLKINGDVHPLANPRTIFFLADDRQLLAFQHSINAAVEKLYRKRGWGKLSQKKSMEEKVLIRRSK